MEGKAAKRRKFADKKWEDCGDGGPAAGVVNHERGEGCSAERVEEMRELLGHIQG